MIYLFIHKSDHWLSTCVVMFVEWKSKDYSRFLVLYNGVTCKSAIVGNNTLGTLIHPRGLPLDVVTNEIPQLVVVRSWAKSIAFRHQDECVEMWTELVRRTPQEEPHPQIDILMCLLSYLSYQVDSDRTMGTWRHCGYSPPKTAESTEAYGKISGSLQQEVLKKDRI